MGTSVRVPPWLRSDQPANASDHPFWNLKIPFLEISNFRSEISNLRSQISDLGSHVSEIHRRGRWRQLSMARWIDLQQLLRGGARGGGFRKGLSIFVFGFARRIDDAKEQIRCFFLLALFVVNRS